VIAVRFVVSFEKLERNRAPFLAAIGFVAAMGVIARMAVLEWPTMRTHPLYLLNGYYATEWLAFWFGLVVPRLTTRELGLGAFLPHRREAQ
jgi:hypothetical protein